jgi:hypothetical protein
MRILKRELAWMIAVGTAGVGMSQNAFAQAEPDPAIPGSTRPAPAPAPAAPATEPEEMCDPDTPCTTASTTTTTVTTPAPAPIAQPAPYIAPEPSSEMYVETPSKPWLERVGIGFSAGGGVDDFASDTMRGATGVGGGWNVRATLGTKSILALEGSYIGSAQTINSLGLDNDALLVGNGVQGALRLNFVEDFYAQPFVYGGAAWRHYDISNSNFNTSDVADSDDVAEFPAGVGLAGYVYGMMADIRGEYRFATGEDLAPSNNNTGEATLDRWAVTGSLGFSY